MMKTYYILVEIDTVKANNEKDALLQAHHLLSTGEYRLRVDDVDEA